MMNIWFEAETAFAAWLGSDVTYQCRYCIIDFNTKEVLYQHVQEVHKVHADKYVRDNPGFMTKKWPVTCDICQVGMTNAVEHFKEQHEELPFELYFLRFIFCSSSQYHFSNMDEAAEEINGTQTEYRQKQFEDNIFNKQDIEANQATIGEGTISAHLTEVTEVCTEDISTYTP